jgi:TM2 domain-containing membrane protein YozV
MLIMEKSDKSRWLFVLLAILLGQIGIHNFYAGHNFRGICQLVLTLITFGYIAGFMIFLNVLEAIFVTEDGDGKVFS